MLYRKFESTFLEDIERRDLTAEINIAEGIEPNLAWLSDVHSRLAALQQMPASSDVKGDERSLEQVLAEAPTYKILR